MAKKRKERAEENQRQSRKEVLIAKRHKEQTRRVWILLIAVIGLIVAVLLIGVVNELIMKPTRPVATVNGIEIALEDWRDQVEYRRALLISRISDIADLVGGDFDQIQQIVGQELQSLGDAETLGQQVLEEMIDLELVRQEAQSRGITVSDAEVQKALEERFLYFDGESPTPQPTATETMVPTPSLTPIARVTLTETLEIETSEPTPTAGPTNTPLPTPTAVSLESFEESLSEWHERLNGYGIDEEMFRMAVEQDLYRERLVESLAKVAEVSDEAEQASIFYLRFDNEEEADARLGDIDSEDFLTIWNTINSQENAEGSESTAIAGELLWRTADNLEGVLGPDVRQEAFDLDIEEPSTVIVVPAQTDEGTDSFYIIMVSGREIRPLTEFAFNNAKEQIYISWLDEARLLDVVLYERWRANVPRRPLLDTSSWFSPTPVPSPTLSEPGEIIPQPTVE
jgi:parvulin-like peptidyl-prolyl isomerase